VPGSVACTNPELGHTEHDLIVARFAPVNQLFDDKAPKKPTIVSINSDLLERARRININLPATLETALLEQLRAEQRSQWKSENAKAIEAYNEFVDKTAAANKCLRMF
jgi:antitoxin CcdA